MASRRVCLEMGYKVSERDVENMITVMSPTQAPQHGILAKTMAPGGKGGVVGANTGSASSEGVDLGGAEAGKVSASEGF